MDFLRVGLFVLLVFEQYFCQDYVAPTGSLTSQYKLYYVGEKLTLECTKYSEFVDTVHFCQDSSELNPSHVQKVNSTNAVYTGVVTKDDPAEAMYYCRDEALNDLVAMKGPIYTDYRPRGVIAFEFRWYNKDKLFFNWTFGEPEYKNIGKERVIKVRAHWNMKGGEDNWYPCDKWDEFSCWVNRSIILVESAILTASVTISVVVDRAISVTSYSEDIAIRKHAMPDPVEVTRWKALNMTAVQLTVNTTWERLKYTITYCDTKPEGDCFQTTTNLTSVKTFTVAGLRPGTTYDLVVQASFGEGYFSEPENRIVLTMPQPVLSSGQQQVADRFLLFILVALVLCHVAWLQ